MLQGQHPQAEYRLLRQIDTQIKKMAVVASCFLPASATAPAGRVKAPPVDTHLNPKMAVVPPPVFSESSFKKTRVGGMRRQPVKFSNVCTKIVYANA